jgi:lipoprotein-releasing system ATP-binding protein
MAANVPMLRALQIRKRFDANGAWVLDGVDLELAVGTHMAIVGPSGSGKSTLLGILGTLEEPDDGQVLWGDRAYAALDLDARAQLRRESIGFVFQEHHLLPQCTALQNVLLPLLSRPGQSLTESERTRGKSLLEALGLGGRFDAWPHQLSTGQRQRIAVARALIASPKLILADEPTGSLDRRRADELLSLLLEHSGGAAVVVVTHSERVAQACDCIMELCDGRLMERGPNR